MKDNRPEKMMRHTSTHELAFTKEDREKVFKQIDRIESKQIKRKALLPISKRIGYFTASLLVFSLCILLFIPSLFNESIEKPSNETNPTGAITQDDINSNNTKNIISLFTIKGENDRIHVNLLLSYSKVENKLKVVSIPRDTYSPIVSSNEETIYDKLSFAYTYGSEGAESVRTTVSKLFDIPIDYYTIMDLDTFSEMVASVGGIEYEIPEDIRVRGISQLAFEFHKGTHRFSGEEIVTLMMDATVESNLDDDHQISIINAVMNQIMDTLSLTQLKAFSSELEGNIPIEQLFESKPDIQYLETILLTDRMTSTMINGNYYIELDKSYLESVKEELTLGF